MRSLSKLELGQKPKDGILISFSGVDGAGKTTTIRNTATWLRKKGHTVKIFKLPSKEIKSTKLFKNYKSEPFTAQKDLRTDIFSMGLVVLGDRLNTIITEICPLLEKGYAVIVDRYVYSAIGELLLSSTVLDDDLEVFQNILRKFPKPHISVFNRVSLIDSINRIRSRPAEKDDYINIELVRQRIDIFENLRISFNGVLVDTALDHHSCLEIVIHKIMKELN